MNYTYNGDTRYKSILEDGYFGHNTFNGLISAIKIEMGLSLSEFSNDLEQSIRMFIPNIPYDNVKTNRNGIIYNYKSISNIVIILKILLYYNGYGNRCLNGFYSLNDRYLVSEFQKSQFISSSGCVNLETWLSLLFSFGDKNRSTIACLSTSNINSERAISLYNAGYRYIGRYINDLSREEEKIIFLHGMSIFPIFKIYVGGPSDFSYEKGIQDAEKAKYTAESLGIPYGTTIYYSLDYEINIDDIISYFKGICNFFDNRKLYKIGVYSSSLICTKLKETSGIKIDNIFINENKNNYKVLFSYNFSFYNFSFDKTLQVYKVISSLEDYGYDSIVYTTMKDCLDNITKIYNLALNYTNNDNNLSNILVLQYIRRIKYGDSMLFNNNLDIMCSDILGNIDINFCDLVDNSGHYYDVFDFLDSCENVMNNFSYLVFILNIILLNDDNLFIGFENDLINYSREYTYNDNIRYSNYIANIDAINIYYYIKSGYTLSFALNLYYSSNKYIIRTKTFINNIGGFDIFNDYCIKLKNGSNSKLRNSLVVNISPKYFGISITSFKEYVYNRYKIEDVLYK